MITLLKLNAFGAVSLPAKAEAVLSEVVLKGVEKDHFKKADILRNLTIPQKHKHSYDPAKIEVMVKFALATLSKVRTRQSFDFYLSILDFGRTVDSEELVIKSL